MTAERLHPTPGRTLAGRPGYPEADARSALPGVVLIPVIQIVGRLLQFGGVVHICAKRRKRSVD
jgi:hypothetical protein